MAETQLNEWWLRIQNWLLGVPHGISQPFGPTSYAGEPILCTDGTVPPCKRGVSATHFHEGVDLDYNIGDPVLNLVGYGRVVKVTRGQRCGESGTGGYGTSVIVGSPSGVRVLYGHLSQVNVREGQGVALGDVLGAVGSTGCSTGGHLHLEARDASGLLIPLLGNTPADVFDSLKKLFGASRPYAGQTNPGPPGEIPGFWSPYTKNQGPSGLPGGLNLQAGGLGEGYSPAPVTNGSSGVEGQDVAYPTGQASDTLNSILRTLTASGGPLGAALAVAANELNPKAEPAVSIEGPGGTKLDLDTGTCGEATLVLVVAGLGVLFLIMGIVSMIAEKPVQDVAQTAAAVAAVVK